MRWSYLRMTLAALLVAAAVSAALLADRLVRSRSDYRLVNVGGAANSCQCTQRIER